MTTVEICAADGKWRTHDNVDEADASTDTELLYITTGNETYFYPFYNILCWKVTVTDD